MAGRKLFCTTCGHGVVVEREVPAQCTTCGSSTWRSAKTPAKSYTLSEDDRIFLRVQGIDPEA